MPRRATASPPVSAQPATAVPGRVEGDRLSRARQRDAAEALLASHEEILLRWHRSLRLAPDAAVLCARLDLLIGALATGDARVVHAHAAWADADGGETARLLGRLPRILAGLCDAATIETVAAAAAPVEGADEEFLRLALHALPRALRGGAARRSGESRSTRAGLEAVS